MDFVAGARAKKVFDFGKYIPDPLYGTSDALQFLTLGIYKTQPFHDFMDLQMSTQHSRVHQALMEGSAKVLPPGSKTTRPDRRIAAYASTGQKISVFHSAGSG